jgi:hypothetical protein
VRDDHGLPLAECGDHVEERGVAVVREEIETRTSARALVHRRT